MCGCAWCMCALARTRPNNKHRRSMNERKKIKPKTTVCACIHMNLTRTRSFGRSVASIHTHNTYRTHVNNNINYRQLASPYLSRCAARRFIDICYESYYSHTHTHICYSVFLLLLLFCFVLFETNKTYLKRETA